MNFDVYQAVTDKVIASLEKGTVPWHQPWTAGGGPRSLSTGKPYRGINPFLLGLEPYESPWWGTYRQMKKRGAQVREGERGSLVVLWKRVPVKGEDPDDDERRFIPLLRYFKVFNAEQVDGLELTEAERALTEVLPIDPIEAGEQVIANMPDAPALFTGRDAAYYIPTLDEVHLPSLGQFDDASRYYGVAFHELVHSTGHEKRLDRDGVANVRDTRGVEPYAREELVAELGSSMIAGAAGIDTDIEQSAAYIASWLKALENDPKLVVQAGARAQRAADFILDVQHAEQPEQQAQAVAA